MPLPFNETRSKSRVAPRCWHLAPALQPSSSITAQQPAEPLREEGRSCLCFPGPEQSSVSLGWSPAAVYSSPAAASAPGCQRPPGPVGGLGMSRAEASCGLGPRFPTLMPAAAGGAGERSMGAALAALCCWKTFRLWEMFPRPALRSLVQHHSSVIAARPRVWGLRLSPLARRCWNTQLV